MIVCYSFASCRFHSGRKFISSLCDRISLAIKTYTRRKREADIYQSYAWSLNNAFSLPIPTSFLALVTLYAPVQIIVILICQIVSSLAAKREAHLQIHNDVEDEARHDGHRWLAPFRPSGSDVTGSNGIIRHLPKRDGRPSHLSQMPVLPTILVNLHTAVSSVLLVQGIKIARSHPSISNSPFLCAMSSQWQSLFAARNRQAISMIEQTLQCCGFRTVRDRAWPWTDVQAGVGPDACVRQLGFTTPCFEGWGGEYGNVGGLCIAAVGVGWFAAVCILPIRRC